MAALIARIYQQRHNLRSNRIFRDRLHPLDRYDDIELFGKFRFRRQDILQLTDELEEIIALPHRKGALPPVLHVLLTLRFYACGSFQDVCGELVGVHQATASRTITRVTEALLPLASDWIRFQRKARLIETRRNSTGRRHSRMCSGASTERRSESSHLVPLAMSTNMIIERITIRSMYK